MLADALMPSIPLLGQLSPRQRQTLILLLSGEGEKQIAQQLCISQHTVHVYVKGIYKSFGVCGKSELFALIITHLATRLAQWESGNVLTKRPLDNYLVANASQAQSPAN